MDNKDIAALLESLCEHPFASNQAELTPEVRAFCREALAALSPPSAPSGDAEEVEALRGALAAVLSDTDTEPARRILQELLLRSATARLDAQSGLAFADAVEHELLAAPAHLVEDILADQAAANRPAAPRGGATDWWSRIAGHSWSARRWGMAATGVVLLAASIASWPLYQRLELPSSPAAVPAPAAARAPSAIAPAPPAPAMATTATPSCETRPLARGELARSAAGTDRRAAIVKQAGAPPAVDCTPDEKPSEAGSVAARARQADTPARTTLPADAGQPAKPGRPLPRSGATPDTDRQ